MKKCFGWPQALAKLRGQIYCPVRTKLLHPSPGNSDSDSKDALNKTTQVLENTVVMKIGATGLEPATS